MDLLGSILGSMEKPPSLGDEEKKKVKAQKALIEKQQEAEKKKLNHFRIKIEKRIHEFIKDGTKQNFKFEPMDKVYRAIVHEVADVAGLTSFSFGEEEEDRYVMLWKKEFAPCDEELLAYRKGEQWDPEKAKELAKQKELALLQDEADARSKPTTIIPATNYKDKYKHLIGEDAAKDAAKQTMANRSYGFVPSENKRDQRTIEQVLADTRAKKKLKTSHSSTVTESTDEADNSKEEAADTPTSSSQLTTS
ncbi:hypothetical protein KUTeg_001661 [Tegillarca granosa]|uniref:R3H domain-containing protein n=1 Tax=Tegillarca granosa TaxID=220873 RepID=A0ABQ9FS37_TEGGR|nr:hypothetical protein KUTeg_001661 [Tegillarca granosa]